MIGACFFVLVYFKAEADLRMLVILGFGTWIALIIFILLLGLANKYGIVRNPGAIWCLPPIVTIFPFIYGVIYNLVEV
jgi:hypothetical protein